MLLLLLLILLLSLSLRLPLTLSALKRAEHRSGPGAKRRTCLSEASCAPAPGSRGAQGTDAAQPHRLASAPAVLATFAKTSAFSTAEEFFNSRMAGHGWSK
ncbi:hypothetical protein OK348_14590 [Flavobacterium sp. MXW15]|nr:hypothetical protein [Flavobacterium sp. MXW15]